MSAPKLDEGCLIFIDKTYFELWKNSTGYHPGPVMLSTNDGALSLIILWTVLNCNFLVFAEWSYSLIKWNQDSNLAQLGEKSSHLCKLTLLNGGPFSIASNLRHQIRISLIKMRHVFGCIFSDLKDVKPSTGDKISQRRQRERIFATSECFGHC